VILEVALAKAAELGGVVMAGLDRALAVGGHKSRDLTAAGVYLDCKKRILEERVRLRPWNA
jgi:hypothetical protein